MKWSVTLFWSIISISVHALFGGVVFASERPNILFIHHSVGQSLIRDGSVREILTEAGFDFWDHGYNHPEFGLRNEKGEPSGCYWITDNDTNPYGLANLFGLDPDGKNAFNKILEKHDVIIFKSCFPASRIKEDSLIKDLVDPKRRSIYNYKRHYLNIRSTAEKFPEKFFLIVTQPPLHPSATNKEEAKRARAFVEWLKSKDYLNGYRNLFVFDYFSLLADPETSMLRSAYQIEPNGKNSHPNAVANMLIGPQFADFIINTVKFKANFNDLSTSPDIVFDNPEWPNNLIRSSKPSLNLSGKIRSFTSIKKIFWSNLNGHGGDLKPSKFWTINDLALSNGVTKVVVATINEQGFRSSSAIGVQYYSGKAKEAIIFDESVRHGRLSGISVSEKNPFAGRKYLVLKGSGQLKRVAINGIELDISDFDPRTSYLEICYDQGSDKARPKLFMPGIGSVFMDVDDKSGYEKIIIPFNRFRYVHNMLDRLIIRGSWEKNSKVYLDSIRLICSDREQKH